MPQKTDFGWGDLIEQAKGISEPTRSESDGWSDLLAQVAPNDPRMAAVLRPKVPDALKPPISLTSQLAQGVGYGIMSGLYDFPSGLANWMTKHRTISTLLKGVDPVFSMLESSEPALTNAYKGYTQEAANVAASLKTGVFSVATQKTLQSMGSAISAKDSPFRGVARTAGKLLPKVPDIVSESPEYAGAMIGAAPMNVALYGGAGSAVGNSYSLAGRFAKHLAASSTATAAQSYLLQLRDGESDWMRVVRDLGMNAAFETLGMSGLRKAWIAETEGELTKVVPRIAHAAGVSPETAELKISQIRAGGGVTEPSLADAIVKESELNPKLAKTPVVIEAKKALQKYWQDVVPQNVSVDAKRRERYGVSFDVLVDGKPVVQQFQILASKENPRQFAEKTDQVARRIVQLSEQGHSVRIDNVAVAHPGTYSRFVTRLKGLPAQYGRMDARELTEFERNLGQAAPAGTIAEHGVLPENGTKVVVQEPDRPREVGTVVGKGDSPSTVKIESPVSGEVKDVPMKHTRVWLYEKQLPVKYNAHGDGTNRHFYVDLNHNLAEVEALNAHTEPDNWFRTSMFTEIDREGGLANGPRGFINEDGHITLSLVAGERLTTYDGMSADFGPLDTITGGRTRFKPQYRTYYERSSHNEGIGEAVEPRPRYNYIVEERKDASGKVVERVPRARGTVATDVPDPFNPERTPFYAGFNTARSNPIQWSTDPFDPHHHVASEKPTQVLSETIAPSSPGSITRPERTVRPRPKPISIALGSSGYDYSELEGAFSLRSPVWGERELPERYAIPKMEFVEDPNFIDAQKAADILIKTKHMDPSTPVRVVVTGTIHAEAHTAPHNWTLGELAKAVPGMYSVHEVQAGAIRRGYRAVPEKTGIRLINADTAEEHPFTYTAEAANFLQKQPLVDLGPNLEQDVNRLLKLGWMNTFDHEVEGGDFVPKEAQQVAVDALVEGRRALTKIWVKSDKEIEALRERVRAQAPGPVRDALVEEGVTHSNVGKSITTLEDKMGVPRGTFKVLDLEQTQKGKSLFALYNPAQAGKVLAQVGDDIQRMLGIPNVNPDYVVRRLAQIDGGLEILSAPDPVSQLIYAYGKHAGIGTLKAGKAIEDPVTGRVYRHYPQEVKDLFLNRQVPVEASALPQPELAEQVHMPPGLHFNDIDPNTPPPIMEPMSGPGISSFVEEGRRAAEKDEVPDVSLPAPKEPSTGEGDVGSIPLGLPPPPRESGGPRRSQEEPETLFAKYGITTPFTPRHIVFKNWERETGLPFWNTYRLLNSAKNDAVQTFAPMRDALAKLRGAVPSRAARTDIQLLFEANISGDVATAKSFAERMNPKHVEIAEKLKGLWLDYATKHLKFKPEEVEAFFESFPTLRKQGGNFAQYRKVTPVVPRMWSFLEEMMQRGDTPLTLSERETDFFSLGTRLARMLAYEEHLTPTWNERMHVMQEHFRVNRLPKPLTDYFIRYAEEMKHSPDEALMLTQETAKRMMTYADGLMKKISFGKLGLGSTLTEKDQMDFFGAVAKMGYSANLAYNPSTFIQQYLQLTQTIFPGLQQWSAKGVRGALKWMRDPVLQESMQRRGVTGQILGLGDQFSATSGTATSAVMHYAGKVTEFGLKPMQFSDSFTRVAAYMGKHAAVMHWGQRYVEGKASWDRVVKGALLDLQDHEAGPVMLRVKEALDAGDVQTAAHRAAEDFQTLTNFDYSRGATPRILDGTMGRFLGRYGNWPLSFVAQYKHMAAVGEQKLTWNKARAFGTALALNTGMMYAMQSVVGLDASKWSLWKAGWYYGGPYMQLGFDLGRLGDGLLSGDWKFVPGVGIDFRNAELNMIKARTERQLRMSVAPGSAAAVKLYKASQAAMNGDMSGVMGAILGMPPAGSQAPAPGSGIRVQ